MRVTAVIVLNVLKFNPMYCNIITGR